MYFAFDAAIDKIPSNTYICPHCGYTVAISIKTNEGIVGINASSILNRSNRMVSSTFSSAELDISEEDPLYQRVVMELRRLMEEISLTLFGSSWNPGLETIIFEEVFDVGDGMCKRLIPAKARNRVKLLAESIDAWWVNPRCWRNLFPEHDGRVTIVQWLHMYENRDEWFSKNPLQCK